MLASHVAIFGPSGGGKTTHARKLHAEHPERHGSIFLTPDPNEQSAETGPGKFVRSPASYPSDIEKARKWGRTQPGVAQIIVDEAQEAPSFTSGEGPAKDGLHRDRSAGIKWVILTQNPMDLRTDKNGYGPVQQCEYWVFCGPLKDWHVGFLNANNMNGLIEHMPTENFEYVVVEPKAALSGAEKIVYRGETEKQYSAV